MWRNELKGILVLAGIGLLFLSGCASLSRSFVDFEVLEPAGVTYPETVEKVALLNRAPISMNSFGRMDTRKLELGELLLVDTIICNNLFDGVKDGMKNETVPFLNEPEVIEIRRRDTLGRSQEISNYYLSQLFELHSEVDAFIALEYYDFELSRTKSFYDFSEMHYVEEFYFSLHQLWRIYVRGMDPIDEYFINDTLFFVNDSENNMELNNAMIVRDGSYEYGFRYGSRHAPYWTGERRILYRGGNQLLQQAALLTDVNRWDEAAALWEKSAETADSVDKGKCLHNLAIYYERKDELKTALEYLTRSIQLKNTKAAEQYLIDLNSRIKKQEILFKQLQ